MRRDKSVRLSVFVILVSLSCLCSVVVSIQDSCPCDKQTSLCENNCCCDLDCPEFITTYWKNYALCTYRSYNTICYNDGLMYRISTKTAGISTSSITKKDNQKCIDVDNVILTLEKTLLTDAIPDSDLLREAPTVTQKLTDEIETNYLTEYSALYFGTNNVQVTLTSKSETINIGIGDSIHVFGDLSAISVANKQNSITASIPATTATQQIQAVLSYKKQGFRKNPLYTIQAITVGSTTSKATARSRTDLLSDTIDSNIWSIDNAIPLSPTFFPTLPPDIFYPIWYNSMPILKAASALSFAVLIGMIF